MRATNFLSFGLLTAFLLFILACNTPDAWADFTKCGSNACVKEALAVKDAFLKDPKTTLEKFTATYEKGDDHVIGWLYLLRDSVLLNEKFSPTAERIALQQQIVEAAKPFLDDPKLSEMAKSVTQEIENLSILAKTEDKGLENITGTYAYEQNGASGAFKVLAVGADSIRYAIEVFGPAPAHNQGMLEGFAQINSAGVALLGTTEFGGKCEIEATFKGETVVLKTRSGDDATCGFGHNIRADGAYKRSDDLDPFRAEGGDPVPAKILGRWKSTEDPKSEIEITETEYADIYDSKPVSRNLFAYFKTCPKDCASDTNEPCLRVSAQDDMCYSILFADGKTLQLVYLGGTGKTLTFKRK